MMPEKKGKYTDRKEGQSKGDYTDITTVGQHDWAKKRTNTAFPTCHERQGNCS